MIKISKAKQDDCIDIIKLESKVRGQKETTSVYELSAYIEYGYVYVAKDSDKIVGAIISFVSKDDIIFVGDFVVDPKYRNKGIGRKLYGKLIKKGKTIRGLVGPSYDKSIHLHESLGFKLIKKLKYPYSIKEYPVMYLYEYKIS